jgi:hypothetical protein
MVLFKCKVLDIFRNVFFTIIYTYDYIYEIPT